MALAEEMVALNFASLSAADIEQLQNLILDYAAVTLCGSVQPWGQKLTRWAIDHGAVGKALLIGSGLGAGAATTGLVNGTSAHGYELDDTHERSFSHPGAVVITTALAVAAEQTSCGRDVLAAIAAGYEVMTRIGMAAKAGLVFSKGMHPTCLLGPFGAAATAAKLIGLDAEGMARAWGLALSMAGGANQYAYEPDGTMVKRMHAGIPAHNGIVAAQLSALGVTAPVRAIEGENGFFSLFTTDPKPSRLFKPKSALLEIHEISLKPYACCRLFHALIDALKAATNDFSIPVEKIVAIEAHLPGDATADKHMNRRPDSVMAAQYSLPYVVGATLAYGPMHYEAYETSHHQDPNILSIIDKVSAYHDKALQDARLNRMSAHAVIRLDDGQQLESIIEMALGSPEWPLDREGILSKAHALATVVDPSLKIDNIAAAIDALPKAENILKLTDLLVLPGYKT